MLHSRFTSDTSLPDAQTPGLDAYLRHPRRAELIQRHYSAPAILRCADPATLTACPNFLQLYSLAIHHQRAAVLARERGDEVAREHAARTAAAARAFADRVRDRRSQATERAA